VQDFFTALMYVTRIRKVICTQLSICWFTVRYSRHAWLISTNTQLGANNFQSIKAILKLSIFIAKVINISKHQPTKDIKSGTYINTTATNIDKDNTHLMTINQACK